jgi:hypothetical protein
MHIHNLPITLLPAHNSSHNDQLVLEDKVAYTSLVVPAVGVQVEFQGGGELDKEQEKDTEECPRAGL